MFGKLECSIFYNEEGGDPFASEPLIVRVTLLSKLKGVAFWMILLPFLLLKENRTAKALWVFLPYFVWLGIAAGLGAWLVGGVAGMIIPLPAILSILLLAGERMRRWSGGKVLLGVLLCAVLAHVVWACAGEAENLPYSAIGSAVLFLLVLVSFLLARLCCRREYGGAKLALCLLPAILVLALLAATAAAGVMFWVFQDAGFVGLLVEVLIPAVLTGLAVYLLVLSFLAVSFSTEFYRSRLCGLLKLRRNVPPVS